MNDSAVNNIFTGTWATFAMLWAASSIGSAIYGDDWLMAALMSGMSILAAVMNWRIGKLEEEVEASDVLIRILEGAWRREQAARKRYEVRDGVRPISVTCDGSGSD